MIVRILILLALSVAISAVSPYLVLELEENVSQQEVVAQYKKLTKKLKKTEKSQKKKELYDAAYK